MKRSQTPRAANYFYTLICLAGLLLLHVSLCAQVASKIAGSPDKQAIVFSKISWDSAQKKAAVMHKRIFVDAYASWCGPCKQLKATTFKNQEAAVFFNQHLINLSIDMEKGEGVSLATKWGIQAYPTLIIFNATGEPVLEAVGFLEPRDLIRFGNQALAKKPE